MVSALSCESHDQVQIVVNFLCFLDDVQESLSSPPVLLLLIVVFVLCQCYRFPMLKACGRRGFVRIITTRHNRVRTLPNVAGGSDWKNGSLSSASVTKGLSLAFKSSIRVILEKAISSTSNRLRGCGL